ncbi:hypothetical protein K505DRAFT_209540, partial [Melanomma pulvis-pyrius CBS 109.77]
FEFEPRLEAHRRAPSLTKESIPYAIALQLEKTGCNWEDAAQFTKYLFSNGLDGYVAQQEKERIVKLANELQSEIVHQALEEEKAYRLAEDSTRLSRRIFIANIAAGSEEGDLLRLLHEFKWYITEIRFTDERHINRTRTAYVEMNTRDAAKRASRFQGHIFGLQVVVNLAV